MLRQATETRKLLGRRFCFLGGGGTQTYYNMNAICSDCKQQAPQLCPQGAWGRVLVGPGGTVGGHPSLRRGSFHEIITSGTSLSPLLRARDKDPEMRLKF